MLLTPQKTITITNMVMFCSSHEDNQGGLNASVEAAK